MSLPPLRQVITADTSQFDRALGNATSRLRRFAGPAAIGAAVTALTALTRASMRNIDELSKQARALGLATNRLQAMTMVAREAGVSQGQLTTAIGRMQQAITQAGDGMATATRALERLGLAHEDLARLAPDEQFRRIAESLSRIQDPAQRTTAAMEIFGRAGRDLINMLDDYGVKLDEATEFQERFGIAVSDEQAQAIERANDAIGRLGMAFQGLGNTLAVLVTPAVEAFARVIGGAAGAIANVLNPATAGYTSAAQEAKAAQEALNAALGVFHETAAPTSAHRAAGLAQAYRQQAAEARDAAAAELAKAEAELAGFTVRGGAAGAMAGAMDPNRRAQLIESEAAARSQLARATRALADANRQADRVMRDITGRDEFGDDPASTDGEPQISAGISGAGGVASRMAERLEALVAGLQTEREVVDAWYAEGLEILRSAREQGLLTEIEYMEQRERLEEEHQRRLAGIREAGHDNALSATISAGQQILAAVGQNNERIARAAQALGQFEAMVNAYRAAAQVLADPTVPWWQKLTAAAGVLSAGIGFANSIGGMSRSGGGGAGGATQTAQAQAQAVPVQRMVIETQGGGMIPQSSLGGLIEQINEAGRQGYVIDAQFVGGGA